MTVQRSADDLEQRLNEHLTRAGGLLRGEQVEAAEREVSEALRLSPDDLRARNLLGLVRFRAGRFEEAQQVYRELVTRDPDDTALRLNLGLVELRLARHAEAAEQLKKVVDKEPHNRKAQGYYGLALMRAGDLPGARQAFLAGGQPELARQVDEQLAAVPAAARGSASGRVAGAAAAAAVTTGLDVELPLESALPATAAPEPGLPTGMAAFVDAHELRPGRAGEPFSVEGGLLVVRVEGRLPMRTIGAIASSGRLAYTPITRRLRGRASEEPFGQGEEALVTASGSGTVVLSPRGARFTALLLGEKDVLYLREAIVFAFEESLYWENGRIPGGGPEATVVAQFRGQGRIVLRSNKAPRTVKVTGGDVLYVDQEALLGWTGGVVPQQLRGVDGQPTQFVSCSGEGAILIEEPPPPSPART